MNAMIGADSKRASSHSPMADRISPSFKRPPDANKPSVDGRAPHFGARPSDTRSANSWPRLKYVMKEAWRARARDSAQTKMGFSMFKRTSPFVAWGYLIFIAYATLSPAHLRPELTASEPLPVVILEHVEPLAFWDSYFQPPILIDWGLFVRLYWLERSRSNFCNSRSLIATPAWSMRLKNLPEAP